ncbi:MAG: chemotaxis protein CheA [Cytophagales bacterium]|nr:chemotaxis protein CheA [Cytophagales bacterium]
MDSFQASFINEATELLVDLEAALLDLENDTTNKQLIGEIFRVMHTLKGTASMFGFENIGEITHHLENIYDQIRSDKLEISTPIFDVTLTSLDHIRYLLENPNFDGDEGIKRHKKLLVEIISIVEGDTGNNIKESIDSEEAIEDVDFGLFDDDDDEEENDGTISYLVYIEPIKEIFSNGTNPLFLIEDLHNLGNSKAVPLVNKIPTLQNLDPESCYSSWKVILSTKESVDEIMDVFIFVEDECEVKLDKIIEKDILQEDFIEAIGQLNIDEIDVATILDTWERTKSDEKKESAPVENVDFGLFTKESVENKEPNSRPRKENSTPPKGTPKQVTKPTSSIRVSSDKLDELMNLVSQLVTTQASLQLYASESQEGELETISESIEKISRQLRDTTFSMCLVPIETLYTRFTRLVRDISNDLGKKILFRTEGGSTELDKTIIEQLTDPLLHILRNSLDHGIESEEKRIAAGKPAQGTITVNAYYSGTYVNVGISDDGGGIDPEKIRDKAISKGVISPDKQLTKKETLELIFAAGFSTAEQVTGVSGRGVGMDVVKKNINDLRGEIIIDSNVGEGTTMTLKLPLTLSIIDGLLVKIDNIFYVIPLAVIKKCYEVANKELSNQYNNLIIIEEDQIPFCNLRNQFKVNTNAPEFQQLIVVKNESSLVGLVVDEIVGEYQAVLKPLGKYYKQQDIFSGSTILGDGTVALVLDTHRIINQNQNNTLLS